MRSITWTLALASLLGTAGCVDAPITPAHLEEDGQLTGNWEQSLVSSSMAGATPRRADSLALTAVLAAQRGGPLEDRAVFSPDVGSVYLHIRADGLEKARPVTFVWSHGDERDETMGFLQPSDTLARAASHPVAPEQTGKWKVEVYGAGMSGATLLLEREFEIAEAFAS